MSTFLVHGIGNAIMLDELCCDFNMAVVGQLSVHSSSTHNGILISIAIRWTCC